MYWENIRDANMRLSDTIVQHGGIPILVHEIGDDKTVIARKLEDEEMFQFEYTPTSIDTTPVKLGYTFCARGGWQYMQRMPSRRYKQGLSLSRLAVFREGRSQIIRGHNVPSLAALSKTITNQYVSFQQALRDITEETSVAFHRKWLLCMEEETVFVHYRGEVVGHVDDGEVLLNDRFGYLRETLQESMP